MELVTRAKPGMDARRISPAATDRASGAICELFFKCIKWHLRIKCFLGTSANAVEDPDPVASRQNRWVTMTAKVTAHIAVLPILTTTARLSFWPFCS